MKIYTQPGVPNVTDYMTFLQNDPQIPATALVYPLGAAPTPGLTASASGGSLPSGTVYVAITYLSQYGEALPSPVASVAVTGPTGQVAVASPAAATNAAQWNVYAGSSSSALTLQNATPVAIGTGYTIDALATSGAAPPAVDNSGSPWITWAYNRGLALTLAVPGTSAGDYVNTVYCCATHVQLSITQDIAGSTFFQTQRSSTGFSLLTPASGTLSSSSDQGTSASWVVPDAMKNLTLQDLDFAKTPWGRVWIAWGQDFGNAWGVS